MSLLGLPDSSDHILLAAPTGTGSYLENTDFSSLIQVLLRLLLFS